MSMAIPKPSFKRLKPKQGKRGEFSKLTRDIILERDDGYCRVCGGPAQEIHHVKLKSNGGRGVPKNGMCVCHTCHRHIHDNPELIYFWQRTFEHLYGPNYFKDQYDYD